MVGFYPDKPATATDGVVFERGCVALLQAFFGYGDEVLPFTDKWSQFNVGENLAGIEFKELQNANDFVHIEIAEQTALDRDWVPSGILRRDNTRQYMCGSRDYGIYLFEKSWLLSWYYESDVREVVYGTIRSAVLSRELARENCLYRFYRDEQDMWRCISTELIEVQNEIRRLHDGGPFDKSYRNEADRQRRMHLWRRIDQLTALQRKAVKITVEGAAGHERSANSECSA